MAEIIAGNKLLNYASIDVHYLAVVYYYIALILKQRILL